MDHDTDSLMRLTSPLGFFLVCVLAICGMVFVGAAVAMVVWMARLAWTLRAALFLAIVALSFWAMGAQTLGEESIRYQELEVAA